MFWRSVESCLHRLVVCLTVSIAGPGGRVVRWERRRPTSRPEKPAALSGQFHLRISTGIETPGLRECGCDRITRRRPSIDLAAMVSCDVVSVPMDVLEMVRQEVAKQLPDFDTSKIFLAATHTHTAPELRLGKWVLPSEGVMQVEEYRQFFAERIADAIVKAWKQRTAGSVTWGLSHAVVAYNRRAVYAERVGAECTARRMTGFPRPGRLRGPRNWDPVLLE